MATQNGYKRACEATTQSGKPCKAKPLRGRAYCIAHSDEKTRHSTNFQIGGGRPRKPRVVDVLRERIEQNIDRWLGPLEEGIGAERGVVVGDGKFAHVEFVPDIPTRLRAQQQAFDRAFGRPTQPVEQVESEVDAEIKRLCELMDRRANGDREPAAG